jgi:hypothetical protein
LTKNVFILYYIFRKKREKFEGILLPNFAKFYHFCENIFSENFLKSAKRIFEKEIF